MRYINPFDLLEITPEKLSDANGATINKAKRKLFAEIELSDSFTIVYEGIEISKGDCLRVIDELDNRDKKEFHFFIYQHEHLKQFLTKGKLEFFENYQAESIYKLPEFLDFISQFFVEQYDRLLLENYKRLNQDALAIILSVKPITNEAYYENCYKSTYTYIKEIDNEIKEIINDIAKNKSSFIDKKFSGLDKVIINKVNVSLLNLLPSYFQNLRNQLAFSIRNLARDINNDPFNLYEPAFKIIEIAFSLSIDALTKQTITKDYYTIKKNYQDNLTKLQVQKELDTEDQIIASWRKILNQIEIIEKEIEEGESKYISSNFISLDKEIYELAYPPILNSLSDNFQDIRNQIANAIRSLAAKVNNVPHHKLKVAFDIISIAYSIKSNGYVAEKVSIAYETIKRNFDKQVVAKRAASQVKHEPYSHQETFEAKYDPKQQTNWKKKKQTKSNWGTKKIKSNVLFFIYVAIVFMVILIAILSPKINNQTSTTKSRNSNHSSPSTVNSNTSQRLSNNYTNTPLQKPVYDFPKMVNGNITGCNNIHSQYNKDLKNKLIISCGSNADIAVKLINYITDKSIRYVYIQKNTTYTIWNIPEGKYYLKIAYGSDWGLKSGELKCEGRFTSKAVFEKGEDILNYNLIYHEDGNYDIPSFSLKLNVVYKTNDDSKTFNTNNISENDFYYE